MSPFSIFLLVGIVGVALYLIIMARAPAPEGIVIVKDSYSGKNPQTSSAAIPTSMNQPEGIVFTYSGWILINDFTSGYGKKRRILSKGDCPGVYIDSTSNSLLFAVKTYGATETVLIPNIPALKWIHFVVTINQYSVDIYINGTLRQHHTLGQLPDQSDLPIEMGPGWDGVLGRVTYYPRSLSPNEISKLSNEPPPSDLQRKPSGPQYFDISWYINSS